VRPKNEALALVDHCLNQLGTDVLAQSLSRKSNALDPECTLTTSVTKNMESTKLASISHINRRTVSFSLGTLDAFPAEILHMILNMLTVQDLSRLSRVSLQGNLIIKSLRSYRELVEHAPIVLVALIRTGLVSLHTVTDIYTSFRSANCCFCGEIGVHLWLPSCERCCTSCLGCNTTLRILSLDQTRRLFNVTRSQIAISATSMHSIPGRYKSQKWFSRRKYIPATSAIQLAIKVHGSLDNLKNDQLNRHLSGKLSYSNYMTAQALLSPSSVPMIPPHCTWNWNHMNDMYSGMASVLFPIMLEDETLETPVWCVACSRLSFSPMAVALWNDSLKSYFPEHYPVQSALAQMRRTARTKSGFIDHVRTYPCTQILRPEFFRYGLPEAWESWTNSLQVQEQQDNETTQENVAR
jgi:hypothetical protein